MASKRLPRSIAKPSHCIPYYRPVSRTLSASRWSSHPPSPFKSYSTQSALAPAESQPTPPSASIPPESLPDPVSLYPRSSTPRPDIITRSIDEITALKPPRGLSARMNRAFRVSEALTSITVARKGHLGNTRKQLSADQKEAIGLVRQRLQLDEQLAGEKQRWTQERRQRFRRALWENAVFGVVMQAQLVLTLVGVFAGTWWMIIYFFGIQ